MDPKGKIALVTGGAMGLGFAIAKVLLRHGVKGVSVCDIQVERGEASVKTLQQEFGKEKVIFIKTDVSKETELENAFKQTIKQFGDLDIVVSNAGILNDSKWRECLSINLVGAVTCGVLALKYMSKDQGGKGGVLVTTSSIAGLGLPSTIPIYNATKTGIVGFTRSFRDEYLFKTTGLRAMAICPAYTESEIFAGGKPVTLREEWMEEFSKYLTIFAKPQSADYVGEAVVHMIREGKPGSIWVSELSQPPYEVDIPHYQQQRV